MQAALVADEVTFCASDSPPVTSMSSLPYELIQLICKQATNVLEPRVAVNLSSASKELRVSTQAVRQQLLGAVPSGNGLGTDPFEPTSAYYRSFDEDVPLKAWAERLGHVTAARGVGSVGSPSASGFSGGARAGAKL